MKCCTALRTKYQGGENDSVDRTKLLAELDLNSWPHPYVADGTPQNNLEYCSLITF